MSATYEVRLGKVGSFMCELGTFVIDARDAETAAILAVEKAVAAWKDQSLWPAAVSADVTPRVPESRTFVVRRQQVWNYDAEEVRP